MGRTVDSEKEPALFHWTKLRATADQRFAIYQSILDSSHMEPEYVALLALAGLIALFGLLENSAAVIIGAMLISPLMNPILSAALALLLGDGDLGKRSAILLGLSIAGVVGITGLVASLTPLKQATPEILARTSPNLLDLFIAFLSGLAGTLALRGGSLALTILPGVAIAVAVVPPLAVVGYGLSTHHGSIAGGAFLLFITNLVSIIISAAAVFRVMGFQPHREAEKGRWNFKYRVGISAAVLVLLSIPLFLTLRKAVLAIEQRAEIQRQLQVAFETDKASISDLTLSPLRNGVQIEATLRTTQYVQTDAIRALEDSLRKRFGSGTRLLVDQILVTEGGVSASKVTTPQNPISGGVVKPIEAQSPFDFKDASLKSVAYVQDQLDSVLKGTAIQLVAPPEMVIASTPPLVLKLQLAAPEPLTSQAISLLGSQVASKLGLPVQLQGEVELRGAPFQLILTPANPAKGLAPPDLASVDELIGRAVKNNLHIQVCYTQIQKPIGAKIPRFVSDIRDLLSRSKLKESQWTIEVEPGGGAEAGTTGKAAPSPNAATAKDAAVTDFSESRCELKSFQDF